MSNRFDDFLNSELEDPEFRKAYEEISAQENAKLEAALAACTCPPTPAFLRDGFWQATYRNLTCPVHTFEQPST